MVLTNQKQEILEAFHRKIHSHTKKKITHRKPNFSWSLPYGNMDFLCEHHAMYNIDDMFGYTFVLVKVFMKYEPKSMVLWGSRLRYV